MSRMAVRIACALALALCTLCFAGCQQARTDDAIHLTIKVPKTSHDVVFDDSISQIDQVISKMAHRFQQDYDRPVDINVQVFEQNQYDEAIPDAFDTQSAADILYGDYFNMSSYIHTGRVVPLDDVIEGAIQDDIYGYLLDMSQVEGRTYMLPYLARQNILAYNKDLFRQAGLESLIEEDGIASWSLDQWTQVLDALAANLPENVYPMMMYANSSQGDTHTMTMLRACGSSFFDESGHFALSEPEGVAALRWVQEGTSRGWWPPHPENLEIEDCSSLFRQGQLAIYMVNNVSLGRYGDTIGLVNFPGPDADGCATTFVSGFQVFDNGDEEKVQVAKDFVRYVYEDPELLSYAVGTLPASISIAKEHADEIPHFDVFSANRDNVVDFTGSNPDTRAIREIFYQEMRSLLMGRVTPEQAAANLDERCNQAIDDGIASSTLHE